MFPYSYVNYHAFLKFWRDFMTFVGVYMVLWNKITHYGNIFDKKGLYLALTLFSTGGGGGFKVGFQGGFNPQVDLFISSKRAFRHFLSSNEKQVHTCQEIVLRKCLITFAAMKIFYL